MLADYHIIRRRKLKLNDLYTGNNSSIYWFNNGVNWRAIVGFFAGVWPLLREFIPLVNVILFSYLLTKDSAGLAGTVNSYDSSSFVGWIRLYNLTFIVGLAISFFTFWALNYFFQPPGLGEEAPFVDTELIYGAGEGISENGNEDLKGGDEKQTTVARVSA